MSSDIISRIILRRGTSDNFPNLNLYELGYAYDTNELFIGDSEGNIKIITETQFNKLETFINNILSDIVYFHTKSNHIIYDPIIGATNLINNGKFYISLDKSEELGITLIGTENSDTQFYIDNCIDQGIGCEYCLNVINKSVYTTGISFTFIDQHQSVSSIDKNFYISYLYKYSNIIPGTDIDINTLKIGQVNVILDYSDGTSESRVIDEISINNGSSDDWISNSVSFRITSDKTIDRVYGSLAFVFDDCIGEFAITDIQCSEGNTPIKLGLSDKDINCIINTVNDKLISLIDNCNDRFEFVNETIEDIQNDIETIEESIDTINDTIHSINIAENVLRNTGEFSCSSYWSSTNIEQFSFNPLNKYMVIDHISSSGNVIKIQTAISLDATDNFTFIMIFEDGRINNRDKLDIRLLSGYDVTLLTFEDYTIEVYDEIHSIFIGKINSNDLYTYSSIEYLGIADTYFETGDRISIYNLKLATVDYETTWSPNPKDTVSSIRDYELNVEELERDVEGLQSNVTKHQNLLSNLSKAVGDSELLSGKVTNKNLYHFEYGDSINEVSIRDLLHDLFFKVVPPEILSVKLYLQDDLSEEINEYNVIGGSINIGKIVVEYEASHVPINNVKLVLSNETEYYLVINDNISSAIYYFEHGLKLTFTTDFNIYLTTESGEVTSYVYTVNFNPPIGYGVTDKTDIESLTASDVMGDQLFNGDISEDNEIKINLTHEGGRIFFAIPNNIMEEVEYIRDSNYFNYLSSFDVINMRIPAYETIFDYSIYLMQHNTWMDNETITIGLKGGSIQWL